jgi:hypothetical protein
MRLSLCDRYPTPWGEMPLPSAVAGRFRRYRGREAHPDARATTTSGKHYFSTAHDGDSGHQDPMTLSALNLSLYAIGRFPRVIAFVEDQSGWKL